jgi:hypothetical protein
MNQVLLMKVLGEGFDLAGKLKVKFAKATLRAKGRESQDFGFPFKSPVQKQI